MARLLLRLAGANATEGIDGNPDQEPHAKAQPHIERQPEHQMMSPMPSATRLSADRLRLSGTPSCVVSACASGSLAFYSRTAIVCGAKYY
jgi:3-oxoacyl-(acyl-carrier-protein) synthase